MPGYIRQKNRGFTLVELLVVIGIIALLISILLPVLSGARRQAGNVQCMNNLKTLMQAVSGYAAENMGQMPFCNNEKSELAGNWTAPGWLYWYQANRPGEGKSSQEDVKAGVLWDYVLDTRMYRCPFDYPPYDTDMVLMPIRNLTSYIINYSVGGLPPRKITSFKGNSICFWEGNEKNGTLGVWNDGCNHPNEGISIRHSKGGKQEGIIACFDGHVEWISKEEWDRQNTSLPNRF